MTHPPVACQCEYLHYLCYAVPILVITHLALLCALWAKARDPRGNAKHYDRALAMLEEEQGDWYVGIVLERELARVLKYYAHGGGEYAGGEYADSDSSGEDSDSSGEDSDSSGEDSGSSGEGSDSSGEDSDSSGEDSDSSGEDSDSSGEDSDSSDEDSDSSDEDGDPHGEDTDTKGAAGGRTAGRTYPAKPRGAIRRRHPRRRSVAPAASPAVDFFAPPIAWIAPPGLAGSGD